MNILLVHQNFPAQFKHLGPALVKARHKVTALVLGQEKLTEWHGIKIVPYKLSRGNAKEAHPWIVDFESKVIRGEACLRAALAMRQKGYSPDVILAHPGWGETLFLKEVWPNARLKLYCEFYYHARGVDFDFDPEFTVIDSLEASRVTLKNINMLLHFEHADAGISPTAWQASTFPKHIKEKISVIHDGVDTEVLIPNKNARFTLDSKRVLTREDEVITFVTRALEPLRGFHVFMRSLPKLLEERPTAQVLIVGKEGVSYGGQPPAGASWKELLCKEVLPRLSPQSIDRIHFLGHISYPEFIALLQVSRVHVYLTYPFVLSWSLLEAMSAGCTIVASDTEPLQEVIEQDQTGKLVDFFDPSNLAETVIELLEDRGARERLGKAAREYSIKNYDLKSVCLPKQLTWVSE